MSLPTLTSFLSTRVSILSTQFRHLNANRALIAKVKRANFTRTYPVTLVLPDGATIQVRYPTPRCIIKLPYNPDTCSEEDIKRIKILRMPRDTVAKEKEIKMNFNPMKYVKKVNEN